MSRPSCRGAYGWPMRAIASFLVVGAALFVGCSSSDKRSDSSEQACDKAMAAAAQVGEGLEKDTDADPAIKACGNVAAFAAAMAANQGAIEGDAETWLDKRCKDETSGVQSSAICAEIAATEVSVDTTPVVTEAPTTTVDPSASLIADCVAYIPIGAFTGDSEAVNLWNFIGQDAAQLTDLCESLLENDPDLVDALSDSYASLPTTSRPDATDAPTTTALP